MSLSTRLALVALAATALVGCPVDSTERPVSSHSNPQGMAAAVTSSTVSATTSLAVADRPASGAAAIVKVVEEALRAGLERHDLLGHMAIGAPDAKLVAARRREPGPDDVTLTARAEATPSDWPRPRGHGPARRRCGGLPGKSGLGWPALRSGLGYPPPFFW